MKNISILFVIIYAVSLMNISCTKDEPKVVTAIQIDILSLTLKIGEEQQLNVSYTPSDLPSPTYKWSSSNITVATVSENGLVKAVSVGDVSINATTADGSLTASCKLTIKPIDATQITLSNISVTLLIGESSTLTYTITPSNTTNKDVEWTSDNQTVASVQNGEIKALTIGSANITVKVKNSTVSAICQVTVNSVRVTGITLNLTSTEIVRGSSKQLIATISPLNATNKNINWNSSNNSIATIANGLVTGVSSNFIGSITITATTEDGSFSASCEVTVTPIKVTSITIMKSVDFNTIVPNPFNMLIGGVDGIEVLVLPTNADNKTVTWSNSNPNVINITPYSAYCPINALTIGSSEITVTSLDGSNISAKQIINVVPITELISLQFNANGIINIGGFIYGDVYSLITNNSHSDISLTKFEIIDSNTNEIKASTTDASLLGLLYGGQTKSLGTKLNSVYNPIYKWYFTYNNQEYFVQHQFMP